MIFTMNPHSCCMKICIITQNVDGLQQQAFGKHSDRAGTKSPRALPEVQMASPSAAIKLSHPQLIQAHGQKGLFKCLNTADKCPYASTQSWSGVSLKRPLSDLSNISGMVWCSKHPGHRCWDTIAFGRSLLQICCSNKHDIIVQSQESCNRFEGDNWRRLLQIVATTSS